MSYTGFQPYSLQDRPSCTQEDWGGDSSMPPEPSAAQYSQPMPTDTPSVFSGAQNVLRDSIVAAMENSNASFYLSGGDRRSC
ncbi:LOW QUALITY PROTEIN: hypothetical protein CVT26_016090 [Gymnopilus dilepis]|uniref:Uncharacterized protein n=1 Tax=Gymnopilus dilepis TaxID=231916 RepID=A0A409YDV4_9AGAR|nr:LOW QUALITY PROTEIN: hypothetical protein CVT26_016090 [Gymnopilus dilepis]